eukprot:TRINITY_DN3879_c0_g1_i1.p1 TRINITY_DN3879_c0_g1~~TRINITY_DN3879_c0_g1_i1.p1  ORF type:complete len:324 (-),score=73.08 TRINITY_DN3879_c0_g1_i1:178-1149(-)
MSLYNSFQLLRVLGQGSYATVVLAADLKTARKVAVKCFSKKTVRPCHLAQELEAFRLIQLNPHPNVVECYEVLEDEENVFMVQEYLPHGDLLAYMSTQRNGLDEADVKNIFRGITYGVAHLHSIGLVHRDLKLENVALDFNGNPKLIDFNLSCRWQPDQLQSRCCGSIGYCAPEVLLKRPYIGPEVDAWSMGVVLYLLSYGVFPFAPDAADVSEEQKRQKVKSKTMSGRIAFPADEKSEVVDLISGLLSVDATERFTLAVVLQHNFLKEENDEVTAVSQPTTQPETQRRPEPKRERSIERLEKKPETLKKGWENILKRIFASR